MAFSYAQAARGVLTPPNVSSNPASSASSEHGARDAPKDASNPAELTPQPQSRSTRNLSKGEKEQLSSQKSPQTSRQNEDVVATKEDVNTPAQEVKRDSTTASEGTTEASIGLATPTREHDERGHGGAAVHENQVKPKETDDDWEKVSIPSVAAEKEKDKELKAAPIPAVNFWTQRSQLQQAKLKEQAAQRQLAPTAPQTKPRPQATGIDESRRKPSTREASNNDQSGRTHSGARPPRESQSAGTSPRSMSQQTDRHASTQPPPVDAESWPTPESSTTDLGRRSSTKEAIERSDMSESKPTSRRKEWTQLPFIPSVKFETPIPGAGRRGARAATRGRGAGTTPSDRNGDKAEPGSMGPPPLPKTAPDQDRGRKQNAARSTRASSVPNGDTSTGGVTAQQPSPATFAANQETTPASDPTTSTESPSTQEPSRSSSRPAPASDAPRSSGPEVDLDPFQTPGITASPTQQPGEHVGAESARSSKEASEKTNSKEWQKERGSNPQKSENWRGERRGERPERGRGAYRGRGGNQSSFNSASFTSPLPQNGFDAPKQGSQTEGGRNRPPGQPFGTPFNSARGNPRSQSIPLHMLQGGAFFQPGAGFPESLPPIQTQLNYGPYAQMPGGVPNGMMSAVPFNGHLADFALVSMIVTQLEYYFSVNNLCKDMFLRKNMDSQGFVPLRTIAEFRRIKALLADGSMSFETLRNVASQIPSIEYVVGEDGEDRLRSRDSWKDFVLPLEERLPQAQNEGPKINPSHSRHSTGVIPDFQMSNGLRSAPANVNGFHDVFPPQPPILPFGQPPLVDTQMAEQWASRGESVQHGEDRRTSVTSPLSKVQSPASETRTVFSNMANGHRDSMSSNTPARESTFPDESIAALKVVVKDPDYQGDDDSSSAVDEPVPTRVTGLRGGAGSPEQLERIRALQFGQSAASQTKMSQPAMYSIQGEGPPPHLVRPGYIWEEYLSLRDLALKQRAENHFDGAVVPLYPLWAEFLSVPNQFNVGMYEDFKAWALEDEEKGNDNGKKHLVQFYDAMLSGVSPMTERLSKDVVDIARAESGVSRPVWLKLRAAWRNGATNLKTRKRLTELLTSEEKNELDRGV